jgi:hypothetical protein
MTQRLPQQCGGQFLERVVQPLLAALQRGAEPFQANTMLLVLLILTIGYQNCHT